MSEIPLGEGDIEFSNSPEQPAQPEQESQPLEQPPAEAASLSDEVPLPPEPGELVDAAAIPEADPAPSELSENLPEESAEIEVDLEAVLSAELQNINLGELPIDELAAVALEAQRNEDETLEECFKRREKELHVEEVANILKILAVPDDETRIAHAAKYLDIKNIEGVDPRMLSVSLARQAVRHEIAAAFTIRYQSPVPADIARDALASQEIQEITRRYNKVQGLLASMNVKSEGFWEQFNAISASTRQITASMSLEERMRVAEQLVLDLPASVDLTASDIVAFRQFQDLVVSARESSFRQALEKLENLDEQNSRTPNDDKRVDLHEEALLKAAGKLKSSNKLKSQTNIRDDKDKK